LGGLSVAYRLCGGIAANWGNSGLPVSTPFYVRPANLTGTGERENEAILAAVALLICLPAVAHGDSLDDAQFEATILADLPTIEATFVANGLTVPNTIGFAFEDTFTGGFNFNGAEPAWEIAFSCPQAGGPSSPCNTAAMLTNLELFENTTLFPGCSTFSPPPPVGRPGCGDFVAEGGPTNPIVDYSFLVYSDELPVATPEPASLLSLGSGILVLAWGKRRFLGARS
jgi:PEP-CTERM motif